MNGERFRPSYDGAESWLRYVGIARTGVLLFLIVGAALFGPVDGPEGFSFLVFALLGLGLVTSLWYVRSLFAAGALDVRQNWTQVLIDFSAVAGTIAYTQGTDSFFTFMFVIVVLETGLLLGLGQGFVIASMASVFMLYQVLAYAVVPPARGNLELWYNFLVQALAFYLTAFISGYWNQRLTRMQRFQRDILDNMNSGFLITDAFGTVLLQNKAASLILDVPDEFAAGRHVSDVLRVDSGGECPVVTALLSSTDFSSYEFRARIGRQDSRLLGLTTNRMLDSQGDLQGIIASFTDLTLMDELRQDMRRQDRLAVVGELAAGLAHEIRNPVAVIRGAVDELSRSPGTSGQETALRAIAVRESDHLNNIVSGFLDFAREPDIKREIFDVRETVREVSVLLERDFERLDALRTKLDLPEIPCMVSADPSQLKQVFVNLGKNALEAMEDKGVLLLTVVRTPGPIEIRFDDEGPGIPPDMVARIFEPFFTTKDTGVGMGLAVCARILTAHDGTIRASSRKGGGCSMVVQLPQAPMRDRTP